MTGIKPSYELSIRRSIEELRNYRPINRSTKSISLIKEQQSIISGTRTATARAAAAAAEDWQLKKEQFSPTLELIRKMEEGDNHKDDPILDYAIEYKHTGSYPPSLSKEKKRAVRKRAATLIIENGEIYLERKKRGVKVITSVEEQTRIMRACHSDPTSGHFGSTKTWRRVAKQFYWRLTKSRNW